MKYIHVTLLFLLAVFTQSASAKNYFVAVGGKDTNAGTLEAPFATLSKAQSLVEPGDTVYIRGGRYKMTEAQIMRYASIWGYVFDMQKSGTSDQKRICYWGYKDERPVFDLSEVKPADKRVIVFYVKGSYLHFKNFEVVGTQVTILDHTQSECFRSDGGNYNIYENLSMHDGMAIGFYLVRGSNNLILNCDAYNNYDSVSEGGRGGNVDGFGGHASSTASTGNIFRGCRAWYNSDDGFDLINSHSAFTIDHCWSFLNGYKPGTTQSAGDGTGFKAGGYGMSDAATAPAEIPMHTVQYCLAYYNKNKGFYANHHLGGIAWYHNTGYKNPSNYCMLNRKSLSEAVDVGGYGHILQNNLSHSPRTAGKHIIDIDQSKCTVANNSFLPVTMNVTDDDFVSLDASLLTSPRKADGSLPDIDFLKLKAESPLFNAGLGCFIEEPGNSDADTSYDWMEDAAILVNGNIAKVVGTGSDAFSHFYVNGKEVPFSERQADLTTFTGELELKAATGDGGTTTLKVRR